MTNLVWGAHLYHTTARVFGEQQHENQQQQYQQRQRQLTAPEPPLALTKYAECNKHGGGCRAGHPAHHRYPVWWTGDGVGMQASVNLVVNAGVRDMMPYVHSDCGGDYHAANGGDQIRWMSYCTFCPILRIHGGEHQPWAYNTNSSGGGSNSTAIEDSIRQYLDLRYKVSERNK